MFKNAIEVLLFGAAALLLLSLFGPGARMMRRNGMATVRFDQPDADSATVRGVAQAIANQLRRPVFFELGDVAGLVHPSLVQFEEIED